MNWYFICVKNESKKRFGKLSESTRNQASGVCLVFGLQLIEESRTEEEVWRTRLRLIPKFPTFYLRRFHINIESGNLSRFFNFQPHTGFFNKSFQCK